MRRLVLGAAVAALLLPAAAAGHPLGNFTVNRAAEITVSGDRIYIRAVLDLAEIPTFQEGARVRAPGFGDRLARSLVLEVDGRRAGLRVLTGRAHQRPGAGGLPTLRFEAVYDGGPAGHVLTFRDESFPGRIGWREVVVRADHGAELIRSSTPARSPSRLLLAYPRDLLRSPLDVRSARAQLLPGHGNGSVPALTGSVATAPAGGLAGLVSHDLSLGFVLASLGLALFWGAAHALGPGHGKAIVAGYLVGARGTARHAALLGLIVTVTHTAGVFALGLVTLALSAVLLPEQLYPWLALASGLLVLGVGAGIVRTRLRAWRHARAHDLGHHHHHEHGELRLRSLVGVGISGGIVPCPTALVVLLAAISLHRLGYGLVLIVAFSLGLAATVTGIGLVALGTRRAVSRLQLNGPLVRALPAASALAVLALGAAMTARALPPLF